MTYCVATLLDAGMVFASDSRTNAGMDNIASFRKMTVYEREGERVMVLLSSGNLSITQETINSLERNAHAVDGRETIWTATSLFDVANLVGEYLRQTQQHNGPHLAQNTEHRLPQRRPPGGQGCPGGELHIPVHDLRGLHDPGRLCTGRFCTGQHRRSVCRGLV